MSRPLCHHPALDSPPRQRQVPVRPGRPRRSQPRIYPPQIRGNLLRLALAPARQQVLLKQGIDAETGRKVSRLIKDSKLKVQASIQGEKVRIAGKQRDDLQAAIQLLRGSKLDLPLQFNNFRD